MRQGIGQELNFRRSFRSKGKTKVDKTFSQMSWEYKSTELGLSNQGFIDTEIPKTSSPQQSTSDINAKAVSNRIVNDDIIPTEVSGSQIRSVESLLTESIISNRSTFNSDNVQPFKEHEIDLPITQHPDNSETSSQMKGPSVLSNFKWEPPIHNDSNKNQLDVELYGEDESLSHSNIAKTG